MKSKTDYWMDRYRSLLQNTEELPRSLDSLQQNEGFVLKQRVLFRNPETGKSRKGRTTEEVYESAAECLSCLRFYKIPSRLREITGLSDENNIEALLNDAGYRSSLIAEELFDTIDECLNSHIVTGSDLDIIRRAYNGISGFNHSEKHMIIEWGYADSVVQSGNSKTCSEPKDEAVQSSVLSLHSPVPVGIEAAAV